jgi:hypothetical protein
MKQQQQVNQNQLPYNKVVKECYYHIYRNAKQLLSTLERDEMRYSLEREDRTAPKIGTIIHEFINPLLYIRLECHPTNVLAIHYGFEQVLAINQYSRITSAFIRSIYKYTSKDATEVNIEDSIRTDWCINTCSEMYEYMEEKNKHHSFKLIKYKPATVRRKQMQAVA